MTVQRTAHQNWPDHADHQIVYVLHGSFEHELHAVEAFEYGGDIFVTAEGYDDEAINSNITMTEYFCNDCNEVLLEQDSAPIEAAS